MTDTERAEQQEAIRQLEEEINVVAGDFSEAWECDKARVVYERILSRLGELCAEKKRGMK
jgi:hypothetical protein